MVIFNQPIKKVIIITKKEFIKVKKWFKEHKYCFIIMKFSYIFLPLLVAISYMCLLLAQLITNDLFSAQFIKVLLVPACTFVFITVIRYLINAPRPYELNDIVPLIKKDTIGLSFPSRHTASVFIIAMAYLYTNVILGLIMLILAVLIGLSRFLFGVHFARDVIAGASISVIIGIIFFFIL